MALYRVQHSFQGIGGTSKDFYVNGFHIWHPTQVLDSTTNLAFSQGVATMIKFFYDGAGGTSGLTIREYLSQRCLGDEEIKIYDTANPLGSPPVYTETYAYAGTMPTVQGLPEEVALCLSYRGSPTGVAPARKRGRIYLGPFSIAAMDDLEPIDGPVRPNPALITAMTSAAVGLAQAMDSGGYEWRVYSPTMNNSYVITDFSVDNAFDTIRGRGCAPTSRATVSSTIT